MPANEWNRAICSVPLPIGGVMKGSLVQTLNRFIHHFPERALSRDADALQNYLFCCPHTELGSATVFSGVPAKKRFCCELSLPSPFPARRTNLGQCFPH